MANTTLIARLPKLAAGTSVPESSVTLHYDDGELVYCGPGPAEASAAYLDAATGDVVVLFEARLCAVSSTAAFFRAVNKTIQSPRGCDVIVVDHSSVQDLISVETPVLLGPIVVKGNAYLKAAAAWPLRPEE